MLIFPATDIKTEKIVHAGSDMMFAAIVAGNNVGRVCTRCLGGPRT